MKGEELIAKLKCNVCPFELGVIDDCKYNFPDCYKCTIECFEEINDQYLKDGKLECGFNCANKVVREALNCKVNRECGLYKAEGKPKEVCQSKMVSEAFYSGIKWIVEKEKRHRGKKRN